MVLVFMLSEMAPQGGAFSTNLTDRQPLTLTRPTWESFADSNGFAAVIPWAAQILCLEIGQEIPVLVTFL